MTRSGPAVPLAPARVDMDIKEQTRLGRLAVLDLACSVATMLYAIHATLAVVSHSHDVSALIEPA